MGMGTEKVRVSKRAAYPFLLFGLVIVLAFISSSFIAIESSSLASTGTGTGAGAGNGGVSDANTDVSSAIAVNPASVHQTQNLEGHNSDRVVQELPENDPALNFWVKRHLLWHDLNRFNTASRKLIFRVIGAGLGDHIKALVAVYGYAVLTRRVLLIDWVKPYPISEVLSKRARRRFVYRAELDGVEGAGHHFNFKYGHGIPDYMMNLMASDEHTVFLKTGPAQTPNEIMDKLRGERWNNLTLPKFNWAARRTITRILLEPSIELDSEVQSLQRHYSLCAHGTLCLLEYSLLHRVRSIFTRGGAASLLPPRHYFTVHARLGLGTGETHYSRFKSSEGNEQRMAECFARQVLKHRNDFAVSTLSTRGDANTEPPVAVFVASDTASWRPLFKQVMQRYLPDAHVVHLDDKPGHWRAIPTDSEAGRRTFLAQHAEMLLIGDATRVIAFSSGFPETGFWRGRGRHFTRLDPDKCLRENP